MIDDAKVVGRVARIIAANTTDCRPDEMCSAVRRGDPDSCDCYMAAISAIAAYKAALSEAGYVIVPKEPTEAMVEAAAKNFFEHMPDARDWMLTYAKDALRDGIEAAATK